MQATANRKRTAVLLERLLPDLPRQQASQEAKEQAADFICSATLVSAQSSGRGHWLLLTLEEQVFWRMRSAPVWLER